MFKLTVLNIFNSLEISFTVSQAFLYILLKILNEKN